LQVAHRAIVSSTCMARQDFRKRRGPARNHTARAPPHVLSSIGDASHVINTPRTNVLAGAMLASSGEIT